jgi:hypothetical protein
MRKEKFLYFCRVFEIFNVMKLYFYLLLAIPFLVSGCDMTGSGEAGSTAGRWAEAYFNCDFEEAREYTTAEGCKWLQYAASNMTEGDVELLNAQPEDAEVTVTDVYEGNDSMATARIHVSRWLAMDSVGQASSLKEDGIFSVDLVKRNGRWQVRMAGLPQSEKQSRD